ncbi:ABC transporter substrate-binding protein, partial [Streptomyces sp. SID7803]|nr:ABC transporter substrate-binding protein [Streptomyces sp. SID7803]
FALAACGTTDADDVTSKSSAKAPPASKSCADDTTATSTKPVSLTDGVGRQVKLDKPAKRIAVLEWQQVEDALTLCVTPPPPSPTRRGYSTWVSAEKLPGGVTDIGTREEPDLDTLYAAKPDLVVVEAFDAKDEMIKKLEKRGVPPVLATRGANPKDPIGNMRQVFSMIGQATGRTERADQVLKEFDAHLAKAKQQVTDATCRRRTSCSSTAGWRATTSPSAPYSDGALFTELGKELGLKPRGPAASTRSTATAGRPRLRTRADGRRGLVAVGDANLFYANDEGAGGYVAAIRKNPIWKKLPAVKEGRAHAFPARVWGAGGPPAPTSRRSTPTSTYSTRSERR